MPNYAAAMHPLQALLRFAEDCGSIDGSPVICGDPMGGEDDFAGVFGVFVVIAIVVAVGGAVYRRSAARSMATKAGMDPDAAADVALLDEHGVAATYVMTSLKESAKPSPEGPERTVEQRLAELQSLLDRGVVTQAEYDARRAAILQDL